MNKLLSIVIPTYSRLESLKSNLFSVLQELQKYSVAIYITDDSPHSDIESFVFDFAKYHKHIFYIKNVPRLGHDKNFVIALKQTRSAYTWILGDKVGLHQGAIKTILDLIGKNQYDIISVNKTGRDINTPSGYYSDPVKVFDIFCWHLTYTGATIYSRSAIQTLHSINMEDFKNFPQIALIFTHLSHACSFFWVNERLVYGLTAKDSYWINSAFSIFIDDWERAIYNLPKTYDIVVKKSTILKHSRKSNLFNAKFLYKMRMNGNYNSRTVRNYKKLLVDHSNKNYILLYIISVTPKWMIVIVKALSDLVHSISKYKKLSK